MELIEVLDLIGGVVLEIDKSSSLVNEYYYQEKFYRKKMSIQSFYKRIFANYENEDNKLTLDGLNLWILDSINDNLKTTTIKYYSLKNEEIFISVKKKERDNKILCYFQHEYERKNFPLMDSLTGVYQKNSFEEIVNSKIQKNKVFFLGIVDVDDFKSVNDSFGHMQGDNVLRKIGNILKEAFPDGCIARIGGDEFAFLCEDSVEYQNVWDRLHRAFDIITGERKIQESFKTISFTMGITRFGIDGNNYEELFLKADRALYRGKRKGKNCFIIYLDELHNNIEVKSRDYNEETNNLTNLNFITNIVKLYKDNDLDSFIQKLLTEIQDYLLLDFASVSKIEGNLEYVKCISSSEKLAFEPLDYNLYDDFYIDGVAKVSKTSDLKPKYIDLYNHLNKNDIKSILRIKLEKGSTIYGSLQIGTYKAVRFFRKDEIELLKAIGKILETYL